MSTLFLVVKIAALCMQSRMFPKQISGSQPEKTGRHWRWLNYIGCMRKYHARSLLPRPNRTLKTDAITRDATGPDQPEPRVDNRRPGTGNGVGKASAGDGGLGVGGAAVLYGRATLRRCGIGAKPEGHQQTKDGFGRIG